MPFWIADERRTHRTSWNPTGSRCPTCTAYCEDPVRAGDGPGCAATSGPGRSRCPTPSGPSSTSSTRSCCRGLRHRLEEARAAGFAVPTTAEELRRAVRATRSPTTSAMPDRPRPCRRFLRVWLHRHPTRGSAPPTRPLHHLPSFPVHVRGRPHPTVCSTSSGPVGGTRSRAGLQLLHPAGDHQERDGHAAIAACGLRRFTASPRPTRCSRSTRSLRSPDRLYGTRRSSPGRRRGRPHVVLGLVVTAPGALGKDIADRTGRRSWPPVEPPRAPGRAEGVDLRNLVGAMSTGVRSCRSRATTSRKALFRVARHSDGRNEIGGASRRGPNRGRSPPKLLGQRVEPRHRAELVAFHRTAVRRHEAAGWCRPSSTGARSASTCARSGGLEPPAPRACARNPGPGAAKSGRTPEPTRRGRRPDRRPTSAESAGRAGNRASSPTNTRWCSGDTTTRPARGFGSARRERGPARPRGQRRPAQDHPPPVHSRPGRARSMSGNGGADVAAWDPIRGRANEDAAVVDARAIRGASGRWCRRPEVTGTARAPKVACLQGDHGERVVVGRSGHVVGPGDLVDLLVGCTRRRPSKRGTRGARPQRVEWG